MSVSDGANVIPAPLATRGAWLVTVTLAAVPGGSARSPPLPPPPFMAVFEGKAKRKPGRSGVHQRVFVAGDGGVVGGGNRPT